MQNANANAANVNALTLISNTHGDGYFATVYSCNVNVQLNGDNWGKKTGVVNVTSISVVTSASDSEIYCSISVEHNSTWDIYCDAAFEEAISELLKMEVQFTEQGMQEDELASMEC